VVLPQHANPENREHHVVFIGRHDARKGLPVLLRAWPEIRERTGARLRVIGCDPLQYSLLQARLRVETDGIDVLGIVTNEVRTAELASAKLFVSPALGGESFGLVLVESFATATPVVASNIPAFEAVASPEAADLVPADDVSALTEAVIAMLEDEPRRVEMGRTARLLAEERYGWGDVARRLEEIYERVSV
jgi:phosphatidylinositol alpha-mannosyltransferase